MDPTSQFIVPTIIDVPELIVTNEDIDYEDSGGFGGGGGGNFWTSKLQFLGTALSYTIGLGNLWRFPYLCYKHAGGAFLVSYTTIIIIVGLPLFLMELAFGQYANEGPITIWRISPAFEGIGYSMCLISAVIAIYYNLINAWILQYLFASLTFGALPWTSCDNIWNGETCFLKSDEPLIGRSKSNCSMQVSDQLSKSNILTVAGNCTHNASLTEFDKIIKSTTEVVMPSNEFFHNQVLEITRTPDLWGSLNWSLLFSLILAWSLVFMVLLKNLRPLTSNRLTLISVIMPYLTLFALLSRAVSLPGSKAGLAYYFTVEWGRLQNIDIWTDAITQIFFSLSPCWGGIITLANMNKFHNNFHSDTMLIVFINYLTSLLAGLICFGTLGFMADYSGIKVGELIDSGIGFVFMVYPDLLAQLPLATLNSIVFFATMLFLGFSSQLTVIETVVTTIVDTWPHKLRYRRPLVLVILCGTMLLLSFACCFGNGFYLMMVLDSYAGTITGMLIGIIELIAIAWVYGMENFMQDIDDMISMHRQLFPSRLYWYFMWRYLTPSTLFAVLLFCLTDYPALAYRGQLLPGWTEKLGWIMTIVCISVIPIIAFIRFLLSPAGSFVDKISYLCRPTEDWAPSSYISGPKLLNRHRVLDDSELQTSGYNGGHTFGSGGGDDDDDNGGGDNDSREGYCSTIYMSKKSRRHNSGSPDGHQHDLGSNDEDNDDEEEDEEDDDDESKDTTEPKVVDGKANYIIPEEEDEEEDEEDTDTGLISNETNV